MHRELNPSKTTVLGDMSEIAGNMLNPVPSSAVKIVEFAATTLICLLRKFCRENDKGMVCCELRRDISADQTDGKG